MKALVILNPAAGKKSSEVVNESLARHFSGVVEYEVYETKKSDKPGDIVRARLRDGFDLVVAAGGDGTVSAVADGLVGNSVPLGIIPVGTGNMLARELNLPIDIDKAVSLIASAPHSRKIDAMKIDGLTRVLSASVGLSPLIIGGASRKNKNRFGNLAYYWSASRNAFNIKRRYLEVDVDGGAEQFRAVEVIVANCGKFFKRLYPLGPDISLDDGHLDVWILSMKSGLDYPLYILGLITGRPASLRTSFFKVEKSVTIKSFNPLKVQVDGELMGKTPLRVELLSGALTVLVAENPGEDEDDDVIRDLYASRFPAYFRRSKRTAPPDNEEQSDTFRRRSMHSCAVVVRKRRSTTRAKSRVRCQWVTTDGGVSDTEIPGTERPRHRESLNLVAGVGDEQQQIVFPPVDIVEIPLVIQGRVLVPAAA